MGQSGLFRCDKCGLEAQLNVRQPDFGLGGEVEQFYCKAKNKIAWVCIGLDAGGKYKVCELCAPRPFRGLTKSHDITRKWYNVHPECRMENLKKLEIFELNKSEIIDEFDSVFYTCLCDNCDGTMYNTSECDMDWD